MTIQHEAVIDLNRPKRVVIPVTQEDSTRRILLSLLNNGLPYNVFDDLASGEQLMAMVEYRRADGTSGMYDTTSGGFPAVLVSGTQGSGKWIVLLDGVCFTVAGWAQINVRFMTESGKLLHSFPITVDVHDTACPDESGGDPTQIESIADMKAAISELYNASMSEAAKQALLNCFAHVSWKGTGGREYYDALEAELFRTAEIVSIFAAFDQGSAVIYDTDDLDTLRQYLTVTATYEDLSTREITAYTLSGTLTEGTSTITVSYGGKTATFDVVVSIGLDSIAFGSLTYRDIFITNNLVSWFGNFENNFVISSDFTYKEPTTPYYNGYKIATNSQANPSISTEQFNSPNHSLDVSSSGSSRYMNGFYQSTSSSDFGVDYLLAYAAKLSNYGGGKVELQIYGNSSSVVRCIVSANTDGWQPVVAIGAPEKGSSDFLNFNFGAIGNTTLGNPNFTAFIDDLVVVRKPTGMTLEQATELYHNFMVMVARGDS